MSEVATDTPRARFLAYVRDEPGARPVVSPFLPHPDVVVRTLHRLGLMAGDDAMENEMRLARALEYEPMFMTECSGLLFPWREDPSRSDGATAVSTLSTGGRTWIKRVSRSLGEWGDDSGFPVRTEADHEMIASACAEVTGREAEIRAYFRAFRQRVGDEGVIVIGHPHVSWLAYQASQQNIIFHRHDHPETFRLSMEAIHRASLFIFQIALEEGIDFMSESCSGLEMSSPRWFDEVDLPVLEALAKWTHDHGGLFWYHNCGQTRQLILSGRFNCFRPDVLETIAPPPEGDNDLAESRRAIDPRICTKGNLALGTLRSGTTDDVAASTRAMIAAVRGFRHVRSTADAVLPGTPPENLIAFVKTAREESTRS